MAEQVGKSYVSPRAALVVNANFVVDQLLSMSLLSSRDHPFAVSLLDAVGPPRLILLMHKDSRA